jgi:hypothetical protein
MRRLLPLLVVGCGAAARPPAPANATASTTSATAAAAIVDTPLALPQPLDWEHENGLHSAESKRDAALMDALVDAFGDTGSALGGRDEFWVKNLVCRRTDTTCQADNQSDDTDAPKLLQVSGSKAAEVMSALDGLDRAYGATGTAAARCTAEGCTIGEIGCVSNRHDEMGTHAGAMDIYTIVTCEDSRIPVAQRIDPPEPAE